MERAWVRKIYEVLKDMIQMDMDILILMEIKKGGGGGITRTNGSISRYIQWYAK